MLVDEQGVWSRMRDYGVFGPSLATWVKCLIDSGCLFWIVSDGV